MAIMIKRQGVMSPPASHSTVYDAFATVRLPSQQLVVALLDVLTEVGLLRNSADRESLKQGAADSWLRAAAAETGADDGLDEALPELQTFLSPNSPLRELSLVTPEEAGQVLRLPPAEVQRLMDSHELEAVQVSPRRQRVLAEALQAYLDRIREGGIAS
ncbi:helix-turn-helix domain-containing protein [Streptacidiphilus jiangxiensis]|nr:helix-turn-helix domain-containing protein [Streptacidiphilus jiangxiensis]